MLDLFHQYKAWCMEPQILKNTRVIFSNSPPFFPLENRAVYEIFFIYLQKCCNLSEGIQQSCWQSLWMTLRRYIQWFISYLGSISIDYGLWGLIYEITLKDTVGPVRPQMTIIRRMRIACWLTNATCTHRICNIGFSLCPWPKSAGPTLCQGCVILRVSKTWARQTIAVMITFTKCNKNSLVRLACAYRSST